MSGYFITFEGVEGSGKSTQVGKLASRLREKGKTIEVVREPGGTRIGEQIREITHNRENVELTGVSEAYLMAASRAQLVRDIIKPALSGGKIVIADRFLDSSLAYQGYGRKLGFESIEQLNHLAIEGTMPDLTFFLDVSPTIGFERRNGNKNLDRLDLQQKDFYQRVYEGYEKLARKYKERYRVIDSSRSIDEVAEEVWHQVRDINF